MKIKKLTAGLCAFVLAASGASAMPSATKGLVFGTAIAASADDSEDNYLVGKCGKNLKWEYLDGTLTISGTGNMDNFHETEAPWNSKMSSIKKIVVQKGAESIGNHAFKGCTSLTEVEIASSVKSIGFDAFNNCKALTSIAFPSSLTTISNGAFAYCTGLTEVSLPESIKNLSYSMQSKYPGTFEGCTSLRNVIVSGGLTELGYRVFSGCSALRYISIPYGVKTISNEAFEECTALGEVDIPSTIEAIGGSAFSGCASLKSLIIPKSVTSIGRYAFEDTPWFEALKAKNPIVIVNNILIDGQSAKGEIVIPNGTRIICESAFEGCEDITAAELPSSVIKIGEFAFFDSGIKEITVPSSVMSVGSYAFANCNELKSITVMNNIETLGTGVFFANEALKSVTLSDNITESFLDESWIGRIQKPEENTDFEGEESEIEEEPEDDNFDDVIDIGTIDDDLELTFDDDEPIGETDPETASESKQAFDSEDDDPFDDPFFIIYEGNFDENRSIDTTVMMKGLKVFGYYDTDSEKFARKNNYVFRDRNTRYGDLDGNEKVEIDDLMIMQKAVAKWKVEYDEKVVDVDGNGLFDLDDLIYLQKMTAGWQLD